MFFPFRQSVLQTSAHCSIKQDGIRTRITVAPFQPCQWCCAVSGMALGDGERSAAAMPELFLADGIAGSWRNTLLLVSLVSPCCCC